MKELKDNDLKELEDAYKPGLFVPIFITLICIAPYLHLLSEITAKNYDRVLFLTLLSAPLIAFITFVWTNYFYKMKKFKKEVIIYTSYPESYQW